MSNKPDFQQIDKMIQHCRKNHRKYFKSTNKVLDNLLEQLLLIEESSKNL